MKTKNRAYTPYTIEAMTLLSRLIVTARKTRGLTVYDVSERAGISRSLLARIEKGDPGCAIGTVFEVAAILEVPLFVPQSAIGTMQAHLQTLDEKLRLMPQRIRKSAPEIHDDF